MLSGCGLHGVLAKGRAGGSPRRRRRRCVYFHAMLFSRLEFVCVFWCCTQRKYASISISLSTSPLRRFYHADTGGALCIALCLCSLLLAYAPPVCYRPPLKVQPGLLMSQRYFTYLVPGYDTITTAVLLECTVKSRPQSGPIQQ